MAIYSEFSHKKWSFSIAMLVYQRLNDQNTNHQSSSTHPLTAQVAILQPHRGSSGCQPPVQTVRVAQIYGGPPVVTIGVNTKSWSSMTWMIWGYPHNFGNHHMEVSEVMGVPLNHPF